MLNLLSLRSYHAKLTDIIVLDFFALIKYWETITKNNFASYIGITKMTYGKVMENLPLAFEYGISKATSLTLINDVTASGYRFFCKHGYFKLIIITLL